MQVALLWIFYGAIAFVLRTLLQLRATGRSGWSVLRSASHPIERIIAALFAGSLAASFAGALVAALPSVQPWSQTWALPPIARAAGFALYVTGTITTFAAQLTMGNSWRIGQDATERTELVAHGLFRMVRNPIYSAMLVTVTGLTLLCCSWLTASAFATLLIALELQVRVVEEPYLARMHGDVYTRYAAKVGRFIPMLGRTRLTIGA